MPDALIPIYVQKTAHSLKPDRLKSKREPYFLLTTNGWDDYSYYTTFDGWYAAGETWEHLGEIKIAVTRQKSTLDLIEDRVEIEPATFRFQLEGLYISLGQSRGYYERIVTLIRNAKARLDLLARLHDVIWMETFEPNRADLDVRREDIFSRSLLRDSSAVEAYGEGKFILFPEQFEEQKFNFEVTTPLRQDLALSLNFRFDRRDSLFPTTLTVIVGENGFGKTQSLYAIQRFLCLPHFVQHQHRPPPFRSVIAVSYSPFEQFPNENEPRSGSRPQYVYCGFRDNDGVWKKDSTERRVGSAFTEMLKLDLSETRNSRPRRSLFGRALREGLKKDKIEIRGYRNQPEAIGFINWGLNSPKKVTALLEKIPIKAEDLYFDDTPFSELSAGQKMFVLVAANVCAVVEPGSMLLIDEPELYLHPNLESAYIGMIRAILELFESYAVVATHSVFVVREVPEQCVWILKKTDQGDIFATRPQIRTYGGDLNLIADYVFTNSISKKPYHEILDQLAKEEGGDFAEIRKKYGKRLGFDGLSYLRQQLHSSGDA